MTVMVHPEVKEMPDCPLLKGGGKYIQVSCNLVLHVLPCLDLFRIIDQRKVYTAVFVG